MPRLRPQRRAGNIHVESIVLKGHRERAHAELQASEQQQLKIQKALCAERLQRASRPSGNVLARVLDGHLQPGRMARAMRDCEIPESPVRVAKGDWLLLTKHDRHLSVLELVVFRSRADAHAVAVVMKAGSNATGVQIKAAKEARGLSKGVLPPLPHEAVLHFCSSWEAEHENDSSRLLITGVANLASGVAELKERTAATLAVQKSKLSEQLAGQKSKLSEQLAMTLAGQRSRFSVTLSEKLEEATAAARERATSATAALEQAQQQAQEQYTKVGARLGVLRLSAAEKVREVSERVVARAASSGASVGGTGGGEAKARARKQLMLPQLADEEESEEESEEEESEEEESEEESGEEGEEEEDEDEESGERERRTRMRVISMVISRGAHPPSPHSSVLRSRRSTCSLVQMISWRCHRPLQRCHRPLPMVDAQQPGRTT